MGMTAIPTYGICAFEIDCASPDEVCIRANEHSSEAILIRRFRPYRGEYASMSVPHKHNFYQMMLFTKGKGSSIIDFVKFEIKAGLTFFMTPGQVHNYRFDGDVWMYMINFSESYFHPLLRDAHYFDRFPFFSGNLADNVLKLPAGLQSRVIGIIDNMITAGHSDSEMRYDLIRLWMLEVLLLIADHSQVTGTRNVTPAGSGTISKFKRLVDLHFARLTLPKDYAELLFVTPSYLNQVSKKVLGKTAGEVIRDRKLLEAKRMLINQDLHISQIAHDLDFTDPSHFSKFFKKLTGQSPEDFRRKYTMNGK